MHVTQGNGAQFREPTWSGASNPGPIGDRESMKLKRKHDPHLQSPCSVVADLFSSQ